MSVLNTINNTCVSIEVFFNVFDNLPIIGMTGSLGRMAFGSTQVALGVISAIGAIVAESVNGALVRSNLWRQGNINLASFAGGQLLNGVANVITGLSEMHLQIRTVGKGNLVVLGARAIYGFQPVLIKYRSF